MSIAELGGSLQGRAADIPKEDVMKMEALKWGQPGVRSASRRDPSSVGCVVIAESTRGEVLQLLYPYRGDSLLSPPGLPKTNAGSAAIFVDEFDAHGFKASPHNLKRCGTGLMRAGLELTNGHNTDSGLLREFLLAPIEQTTGSSTLRSRNHCPRMTQANDFNNSVEKRLTGKYLSNIDINDLFRYRRCT
jgi:hypothetical protein